MSLNYPLKNCTLCPLSSAEGCTAPLAGQGRNTSKYLLLTLNPSSGEDTTRKHFPSEEGQLLEAMLNSVGLTLREFYITTLVKCKTDYGVTLSKENIATCSTAHFEEELDTVKPEVILALGSGIGKAMLGDKFSITKQRGIYVFKGIPTVITYHPRYLLRFPSLESNSPKWEAWNDLKSLKDTISEGVPF